MKARLLAALLLVFAVGAVSASAQSGAGTSCGQCSMDEAQQRALVAKTEKLRSEVDQLIRQAARQGTDADSTTLRKLSDALMQLRANERTLSSLSMRKTQIYRTAPVPAQNGAAYGYTSNSEMPPGYMGISLSGTTDVIPGEELVVLYRDTPIIESVEPGSPAERAGLESGDVLLAYNGEEVKGRSVSLTKLLKPGAKVVVRVRRDGSTKDIPVIVGNRTRTFTVQRTPRAIEPQVLVNPGFEFNIEADTLDIVSGNARIRTPRARATEVAILPPMLSGTGSAFAGAELTASNEALGEYFGTSRGIIVLHVGEGTPARRAGILVGDVITHIDDEPVSRPADFQRALARSKSKSLDLQILRRRTEKKALTLKW